MKKGNVVILVCLVLALLGSGALAQTKAFTDSVGREVVVDREIERIAVTGPLAQMVVFALAPDRFVGIADPWDNGAQQYLDERYVRLPVLGQLYGGKGDLNLETLLEADPQVVIDVGQAKGDVAQDLDALSAQTGIPFVHISASTQDMAGTYAMLGELLGMEEEAKVLGDYCTEVYSRMTGLARRVEKKNLLYITGLEGMSVIARDSYHSEIIDLLSNNLAVLDSPSSKGTGNEVDMEQIMIWNPEVILFAEESMYASAASDPLWQMVDAVANDAYYQVPSGPYNWMGFPPSVQRLLGMLWMGSLLYPEEADYDLYEEAARYFELFYHCTLTREQFDAMTVHSIAR